MSAKSLSEVLKDIEGQLNWEGPNGKKMGHVVIKREHAEHLFKEVEALMRLTGLMPIRALSGSLPGDGDEAKAKD